MVVKKKKGVKKKSSSGTGTALTEADTFVYEIPLVSELGLKPVRYISLTIKMAEMIHLSFEWEVVPTQVTLAGIKESIRTRHGGTLLDIQLYKDLISEQNLLPDDDAATLEDVGIVGGAYTGVPEQLPKVTLYYDTNTLDSLTDCPVLNDTPYEYIPKFLPSTFEARPTTAGKNARAAAAAATGRASPSAPGTPTDGKGVGGGLLKRLGTNAKANTTPSASSSPSKADSTKSGIAGIAATKSFTKKLGETAAVQ